MGPSVCQLFKRTGFVIVLEKQPHATKMFTTALQVHLPEMAHFLKLIVFNNWCLVPQTIQIMRQDMLFRLYCICPTCLLGHYLEAQAG